MRDRVCGGGLTGCVIVPCHPFLPCCDACRHYRRGPARAGFQHRTTGCKSAPGMNAVPYQTGHRPCHQRPLLSSVLNAVHWQKIDTCEVQSPLSCSINLSLPASFLTAHFHALAEPHRGATSALISWEGQYFGFHSSAFGPPAGTGQLADGDFPPLSKSIAHQRAPYTLVIKGDKE